MSASSSVVYQGHPEGLQTSKGAYDEHSHGGAPLADQSIEHAVGETHISRQWIPEELGPTDKTASCPAEDDTKADFLNLNCKSYPPQTVLRMLRDLCANSSHRYTASKFWVCDNKGDRICVVKHKSKKYTLRPCTEVLDHGNSEDLSGSLCTIISDPGSNPDMLYRYVSNYGEISSSIDNEVRLDELDETRVQVFSMQSTKCVFVPLGWLVEQGGEKNLERTTYYVVLLNLSTDPTSVWLMYDYQMKYQAEAEARDTNRLGDYYKEHFGTHHSKIDFSPDQAEDFDAGDKFGGRSKKQDNHFQNFRDAHTNLACMRPTKISGQINNFTVWDRHEDESTELARDLPNASISTTGSKASPIPSGSADTAQTKLLQSWTINSPATSSAPAQRGWICENCGHPVIRKSSDQGYVDFVKQGWICEKCRSTKIRKPTSDPGYFGLSEPFDLALLAPDIVAWSADGLDCRQVKLCLDNSHVRLGSSLRVRYATEAEIEAIEKNRINIRNLCF